MLFIFEVRIKPGYSAEQYAEAWLRASEIIQEAPGARGTRLHRKLGQPEVLLAVASWDSKADRDAAPTMRDRRVQRFIAEQAEFVDIEVVGEFDDPDWIALPPEA